jgi:hypothetical protein
MKSSLPRLLACALALICAAPTALTQGQARQQQPQQPPQQTSPQSPPARRQQSEAPAREASSEPPGAGQAVGPDEVLQVNTRVVFLDALVTDRKTRAPAQDLRAENFEVRADGRRRELAYFSRERDAARKPLALAVIFDVRRNGAGRYLRRTDILEAMARELAKLPATDEVAVVALDTFGFDGRREWLSRFTRDRAQTASALAAVPKLAEETAAGRRAVGGGDMSRGDADEAAAREREEQRVRERAGGDGDRDEGDRGGGDGDDGPNVTIGPGGGSFSSAKLTARSVEEMKAQLEEFDRKHGRPGEADEVDRFVDKKGREFTRTLKPDGTLLIQHVKKDGSVEVDVHDDTPLPRAVFDVTRWLARERPNSQGAILYVTDGITLMAYPERDYVEHRMLRQNAIFNALVTDMKMGFKLARPLLAPLGNAVGLNIYGGAGHIARETGGEALRVRRASDYAEGVARIVGNLSARYSLGFTLAESEGDDGRLHPLEVRARAKDAKGKERKLEVRTRSGYFVPAGRPAAPADAARKTGEEASTAERVKN